MQPQPCSRIDLAELKAQIVKRIGAERSKRYFKLLNMLLSQKLSKKEFDNRCFNSLLGCENVALHNQFVRSILKNACQAKTPPPVHLPAAPPKLAPHPQNSREAGAVWSNGVLPSSPKKGRSVIRERKLKDRPSPLGPNGKVDHFPSSMGSEDNINNAENGEATPPCDYQRPLEREPAVARSSADEDPSLSFSRSPLLAPLGIPFCSASVGGSRKAVVPSAVGGGEVAGFYDSGVLSDTESLRKRMEQIAAAQGLGGVSVECANTMNTMLDLYLKRLIRSCVDLAGARNDPRKQHAQKQIQNQIQGGKVVNGMWPSNHMHMNMHGGNSSSESAQSSISLLDFKAAMELNPQQLGDDWPLLLEKISMHSFEE